MFNVDGGIHFIYSHKYNINSSEDSSDIIWTLFSAQHDVINPKCKC